MIPVPAFEQTKLMSSLTNTTESAKTNHNQQLEHNPHNEHAQPSWSRRILHFVHEFFCESVWMFLLNEIINCTAPR